MGRGWFGGRSADGSLRDCTDCRNKRGRAERGNEKEKRREDVQCSSFQDGPRIGTVFFTQHVPFPFAISFYIDSPPTRSSSCYRYVARNVLRVALGDGIFRLDEFVRPRPTDGRQSIARTSNTPAPRPTSLPPSRNRNYVCLFLIIDVVIIMIVRACISDLEWGAKPAAALL